MSKGKLIVVEGIDGSGKTSLIELLKRKEQCFNIGKIAFKSSYEIKLFTNELNDIAINNETTRREMFSKRLRSIVWFDDLINNIYTVYKQLLEEGYTIITDRYKLSNEIFIEYYKIHDLQFLTNLYSLIPDEDLTIYLNIEPKIAEERIKLRSNNIQSYENSKDLRELKEIYERKLKNKKNVIYIDASQKLDVIADKVINQINII